MLSFESGLVIESQAATRPGMLKYGASNTEGPNLSQKIQDGEFSKDDAVDQFVRFIRLGCVQKGIELSEEDVDKIHMLVLSTMETFMGKKPKQIEIAVNKFNAMNHR